MDNTNQHRVGCYLGSGNSGSRTKIIDPNAFYGEEDSSRNIPVRLEDLTISVKLTTTKRGRTTILLDEDSDTSVVKQQKGATINFIEGSDINGKKVLTTKYTELTTAFETEILNNETFGITNIDIDFNSSYTPMIKIDFIDVRGSSIFQNEEQLLNGSENKYSSFFEFPYPLFELEIKGYYGQPVKYCLHMLKFNSKFNSQTGNFEISCEFIGYTYAMLSDMLLGILKAIPYTKIGGEKFKKFNETREPDILDLVDLKNRISLIEDSIKKAAVKTEEAKDINTFKPALEILANLEAAINNFGLEFTTNESSSTSTNTITVYDFVIMNNTSFSTQQQDRFNTLDKTVKDLVAKYNELNIQGAKINEVDLITPIILNNLTKKLLEPTSTLTISEDPKLKNKATLDLFKKDLLNYLNNNYTSINPDYKFRAMDLRSRFKVIRDQKDLIDKSLKDTNKALANQIKETVVETLGFSPTARNMIEVFTTLIEVYMETVFEVSKKAESSTVRKELFNQVFTDKKENSDYKSDDAIFYPWPLYSEKETQKDNYVEKYLGTNNVLKNRVNDVPELEFINDLLQAFLTAARKEESLDLLNAGESTLFFPVNILDTKLFNQKAGNPYAIKELQNIEQVKRLMILRAMTFLAYSNNQNYLTSEEIKQMALIEANTMLSAIINPTLKVALKTLTFDSLISTFGNVNGGDRNLLEYKDKNYYYKYYFQYEIGKTKVLPINSDLDGYETTTIGAPVVRNSLDWMRNTDNILFLTNYSSKINTGKSVSKNVKYNDYGIYVKMFTPAEYTTTSTLVDTSVNTTSVLDLASLKENNISSAGFNSFGGIYGIQDFNNINFGAKDGPEGTPAMYIFYKNDSEDKNSLAFSRIKSADIEGIKNVNDRNSRYDYNSKKSSIPMPNSYRDFRTNENGKLLHIGGSNRFRGKDINTAPDTIVYPYIEQNYSFIFSTNSFSLFGSKWYYLQKDAKCTGSTGTIISAEKYVKALLFLNTLPFNMGNDDYDPFGKPEIRHLFDIKGGFVHAPRFWAAYVGAVLWWISSEDPFVVDNQIVGGGRGIGDPVIWKKTCGANASTFEEPKPGDYFPKILDENIKIENSSVIRALPEQVRDEFKKVFFDFVNGTSEYISWESISSSLEITNKPPTEFCGFLDRMRYTTQETTPNGQSGLLFTVENSWKYHFNPSDLSDNLINLDNYNIVSTIHGLNATNDPIIDRHVFLLEINGGSEAGQNLLRAFNEEIIIANTGYGIWETFASASDEGSSENIDDNFDFDSLRRPIFVKEDIFKEYFDTYISAVTETVSGSTLTNQEENELNKVFGSSNKDEIKLMLYRHCKNIYDKWLGGITDEGNIIFQCGDNSRVGSNRKTTDAAVAKKYGYNTPRLIDSFRFVTRSFKDIGDELFVNPVPIANMIADEPNTSAYNVISTLLTDNKFEFIALPTFINYKDDKMLESVFTPFNYDEAITTCGPTFVCVYTGQKSNSLDLKSSKYPNDGFDLRCTNDGADTSIPLDFNEPLNDYEEPVSVFVVNYSQQNQNIFKDITLDQSEFTETEESLKIVQDISTKGFENNPSIGGQNMYNIYAVRSYSAEIEMLGNAMIQPMMYFQLNNIPMFHGAYMIIKTKHNIKPNYMSTTFTGTRIRRIETPLIDVAEAYMSLIETLDLQSAGTSDSTAIRRSDNYIDDYVSDLKSSLPKNKTIVGVALPNAKALTQRAEDEFTAWKNGTLDEKDAVRLLDKYAKATPGITAEDYSDNTQPWSAVFVSYIMLGGDPDFMKSTTHNSYVTKAMKGDNGYEAFPLGSGLKIKPEIGCLFCKPRRGDYNFGHCDVVFKINGNVISLIGGNLSDSVKVYTINLTDGYVIDSTNVNGNSLVVLKTNNKYYNKKNLIGTGVPTTDDTSDKSTFINDATKTKNQIEVKNYFKNKGLTKAQVAGIMGNIQKESMFNPLAINKADLNGYPSVGLIQWNGLFTPKGGTKDSNVVLSTIGRTVNEQLNYLTTKYPDYNKWLNLPDNKKTKTSAWLSAYEFARVVERCAGCTNGEDVYKTNKYSPSDRSKYANDYYKRFNTQGDVLFW
jgi:hypothetical protein